MCDLTNDAFVVSGCGGIQPSQVALVAAHANLTAAGVGAALIPQRQRELAAAAPRPASTCEGLVIKGI